jgi:hypothetical protein
MITAFLAAAAVAASQAQAPHAVVDWSRSGRNWEMADAYPVAAVRLGVSGQTQIDCLVAVDGKTYDCKLLSEDPAGFGFGDAALRLAPHFRMTPGVEPGDPDRPHVVIPVNFIFTAGAKRGVTELEFPAWISAPTFADVARGYPARGGNAVGFATLECRVGDDGAVDGACEPLVETPRSKGFTQSARALAPLFRIDPKSEVLKQGKPVWVKLSFRFAPPDSDDMRDRRISAPRWVAAPTPVQVQTLFPVQATANGLTGGRGVASCRVALDGSLADCKALPAEPEGFGFSQAAVALAPSFRMSPWTNGGGPVDGAIINLPIRFDRASGTSAPTPAGGSHAPPIRPFNVTAGPEL